MKYSKIPRWPLFLCAMLLIVSCKKDQVTDGDWDIPVDEVRDGGPGKDGIPSVDNPQFSDVAAANYLSNDDLVVGFAVGDEVRAYPHPILDWHEIVNDEVNGVALALTYCPLTGTAIAWDRELDGEVTTFGVSGLLYESNLIPYDRKTGSNWSQMQLKCVNGSLAGQAIRTYPLVETTWETWKAMYPDTKVMTTETGFDRSYGQYPYGDYRTNHEYLVFPVSNPDDRLPKKERVHGIIVNEQATVFRFSAVAADSAGATVLREENIRGEQVVLVGNVAENWMVSFRTGGAGGWVAVQNGGAVIMEDGAGNRYDVLGRVVDGPDMGTRLAATRSYLGYWFAWGTFFPNAAIVE